MRARDPSREELMEAFEVIDGKIFRKEYVDNCNRKQGGFIKNVANHSNGYCQVSFKGRMIRYHRLLWILVNGPIPEGFFVDHKDGDKLNNNFENLRLLTNRENAQNTKFHRDGRLPGIHWNKQHRKWQAQVWVEGKRSHLGYFTTQLEAFDAYIQACQEREYPVELCLELREKHIKKLKEAA